MSRLSITSCLFLAFALIAGTTTAQVVTPVDGDKTVTAQEDANVVASQKVALGENGELNGNVFVNEEGEKTPVSAKITLSADGVVVDTVQADEEGNFAFASIAPGTYQMYGSSDGYVGGSSVDVMPYNSAGASQYGTVGLDSYSSDVVYDEYGGAPVQSFGDASCGGYSCGGGGGGGGGRGLRRGLILTGAALGIVGIAGGFDGDDDASPTD